MAKNGKCLCGAVHFEIKKKVEEAVACHCDMCRHWTGGIFIAVAVPSDQLIVQGAEHVRVYTSSAWAERAFCGTCGSSLWYRVTAQGPHFDEYFIGMGTLERPSGIPLTTELFIERKPDGYEFSGQTQQLTEEQTMEMFARK